MAGSKRDEPTNSGGHPEWPKGGEPLGEYEEVTLHGHKVGFQAAGEGPLLILLHGITSTAEAWREVMPALTERYTVVAPDLIGHGRSAKPRGDYSLGAYAAGVRDLLAVLGFERGSVVGHSFGGGIAMQFSYLFPEYVERMALIGSGGLGREVHPLLRAATLPGSEWVLPLLAREWSVKAGDAVRSVAAKVGIEAGPDIAEFARGYASLVEEGASEAFIHTMRSVIDHDGQRVSALDRLYLADQMPPDHLGRRRPGDPGRARPQRPPHRRAQPLRRTARLRPLADAGRAGSRRPGTDRIHGGDRAVRVVARAGARTPAAGPRPPPRRSPPAPEGEPGGGRRTGGFCDTG